MSHMNESCRADISLSCHTWLINMCDMTHSYAWHDSLICVPWVIQTYLFWCHIWISHVTYEWVMSCCISLLMSCTWLSCHTWLCVCVTTDSYAWHDSLRCATSLIHMRGMTHSYHMDESWSHIWMSLWYFTYSLSDDSFIGMTSGRP